MQLACFEGVECIDAVAPAEGADCGPCPVGFAGDGTKCNGMLLAHIQMNFDFVPKVFCMHAENYVVIITLSLITTMDA